MEISLSFWGPAFRSFISPPKKQKKTDLSEHYVKVYFVFIFGQPRPVVAAVFLFFSSGGASKVLA